MNGTKGTYQPAPSMQFPLSYQDNFDQSATSSEAAYFSDQSGSWEIVDTSISRGRPMRQMFAEHPFSWCFEAPYSSSFMGKSDLS